MASITPMSFFTPDASINPDEYTFEIVDAQARNQLNFVMKWGYRESTINNIVVPGVYYCVISDAERPNSSYTAYILIVASTNAAGSGVVKQICIAVTGTGVIYERYKNSSGVWSDWTDWRTKVSMLGANAEAAWIDGHPSTTQWLRVWCKSKGDNKTRALIVEPNGLRVYDNDDAQNVGQSISWGAKPYSNATQSAAGLMSAADKTKLDGVTAGADAVSISRSLTSGTKVGSLTINGTATDLYCNAKAGAFTQEISIGTINASSTAGDEVALSGLPSGRTAIGTAGFLITGTNVTGIAVTKCWCNGTQIHYMLRNTFTVAATGVKLNVKVLYI